MSGSLEYDFLFGRRLHGDFLDFCHFELLQCVGCGDRHRDHRRKLDIGRRLYFLEFEHFV